MVYKVLNIFIYLLSIIVFIIIFGFDWKLMWDTSSTGSIAFKEYNKNVSYNIIYVAAIVLNFIIIFPLFIPLFFLASKKKIFGLILGLILFFLYIPKEAITYKFITCFNFYNTTFVQARAALTFIYAILLLSICVVIFVHTYKKDSKEAISTLYSIPLFLVLVIVFILNIIILVKFDRNFNKDINEKTIKMILLTTNEIESVKNGTFIKNQSYDQRIIGRLHDIVNSNDKQLFDNKCTYFNYYSHCKKYYVKYYRKEMSCSNLSSDVFVDCRNASKIVIRMKYIEDSGYPEYNCGTINQDGYCKPGCTSIEDTIKVYLVQEVSNKTELAWNGFGRCEILQPKYVLIKSKDLSVCL